MYEAQAKGIDPAATIDLQVIDPDAMTTDLVVGVATHLIEIDAAIADKARDWPLGRMPVIDLSVMRLATFELMARPTSRSRSSSTRPSSWRSGSRPITAGGS